MAGKELTEIDVRPVDKGECNPNYCDRRLQMIAETLLELLI
jgi:hypothetical protein